MQVWMRHEAAFQAAVASEAATVEEPWTASWSLARFRAVVPEPCMLSSLPAELLTLVAESLVIPRASRLSAQSLAS